MKLCAPTPHCAEQRSLKTGVVSISDYVMISNASSKRLHALSAGLTHFANLTS